MNQLDFLQNIIGQCGLSNRVLSSRPVQGGCINAALNVQTSDGDFFLKLNSASLLELFQMETEGLNTLCELSPIPTPTIYDVGIEEKKAFLLMEWIDAGIPNQQFWVDFGQNLAKQHRLTNQNFGLAHNNHIGELPQSNRFHPTWDDFFIVERLQPQIKLAADEGLIDIALINKFESLFLKLKSLIPEESPALLHGDLWSGNFLCSTQNQAILIDPAVYYGHRETELAFTTLFGGFDKTFYDSYIQVFPVESGFDERIDIHNLYPLLVHVNLFGTSYLSGIIETLNRHS